MLGRSKPMLNNNNNNNNNKQNINAKQEIAQFANNLTKY